MIRYAVAIVFLAMHLSSFVYGQSISLSADSICKKRIRAAGCDIILRGHNADCFFTAKQLVENKAPYSECKINPTTIAYWFSLQKKSYKPSDKPILKHMIRLLCFRLQKTVSFDIGKSDISKEVYEGKYDSLFGDKPVFLTIMDQDKIVSSIPIELTYRGITRYFLLTHWIMFTDNEQRLWFVNARNIIAIQRKGQASVIPMSKEYKASFKYHDPSVVMRGGTVKSGRRTEDSAPQNASDGLPAIKVQKSSKEKLLEAIKRMEPAEESKRSTTAKELPAKNTSSEAKVNPFWEALRKRASHTPPPSSPFGTPPEKTNKDKVAQSGDSGCTAAIPRKE